MIPLANVVDPHMHLGAGRHAHGHLFTEKEVRVFTQDFRGVDGVMVGDGNDRHAQLFEAFIDLSGVVVGFAANAVQNRGTAHPGGDRVNMQVAAHGSMISQRYEQAVKRLRILYERWRITN